MVYQESTRVRLRASSLALVLVGLGVLVGGLLVPRLAGDLSPRPVTPAVPVEVPSPGPFGGTVALYGTPPDARVPAPESLGCRLAGPDGAPTGRLTSADGALLDRRVVDGRAVTPLAVLAPGADGATVTCSGTATTASLPLYVIATAGTRDMVPMAAFSLASLALVLGGAGLVSLRPERH